MLDAGEILNFDKGGALSRALRARGRDPSVRDVQLRYAAHLSDCIDSGRVAMIDAETGVGKTFGYLVPMVSRAVALRSQEADVRPVVVISTASVALQRQISEVDLPVVVDAVRETAGIELSTAMRVGKAQVVDANALLRAATEVGDRADQRLAEAMTDWCLSEVENGVLPLRSSLMAAFAAEVAVVPEWLATDLVSLKPGQQHTHVGTEALYSTQLEECENADVLVVNHHLLGLHLLRPFLWRKERPLYLAVDEADRLPGIMEEMGRSKVPLVRLAAAAEGVACGREAKKDLEKGLERFSAALEAGWEVAWRGGGGGVAPFSRLTPVSREELLESLHELRGIISSLVDDYRAARPLIPAVERENLALLDTYKVSMDRIIKQAQHEGSRTLIYYSPVRNYPGVASIADGAGRLIAKRLWNQPSDRRPSGLLFTSATLGTLSQGSATMPRRALAAFANACGFDPAQIEPDTCAVLAPDRFGDMDFVRPAFDAPRAFAAQVEDDDPDINIKPLTDDALEYWRSMVEAASAEGGRVLVLVPAHRDVLALAKLFNQDDRVVAQLPGIQTAAATARFLARDDSIWFSAIVWEGISLPYAISHIVIPRLPIRPRTFEDTVLERYLEQATGSGSHGRSVTFGRRLAEARRRLRQGIGRGIRSHDDRVKVWIADPRWPISQHEADDLLMDQPENWSATMTHAIPQRFREKLERSERFPR